MREFYYILLLVWAGASCSSPSRSSYEQLKGKAQGTTFSIVYEPVATEEEYTEDIDNIFRSVDRSMSLWDSTSLISQFNQSRNGIEVDEHFSNVVTCAQKVSEGTVSSLDITLGPVIRSWGFIREKGDNMPDSTIIEEGLRSVGMDKIKLNGNFLRKELPSVEIDLNAIAQGYTVDVIVNFLKSKGVKNLLVELGGEVRTIGMNQFDEKWKVGIEKPDFNNGVGRNSIKAVVEISDKALVTSGSNRKFIEVDGLRYSHTINPKSGYPVKHNLLSVSVIANTAMDADAYATAFMVLGVEKSIEIAEREGLEIYCIYDSGVTGLKTASTSGFKDYLLND